MEALYIVQQHRPERYIYLLYSVSSLHETATPLLNA